VAVLSSSRGCCSSKKAMRGFLFLNPSPKEKKESHSSSLVAVKDDDVGLFSFRGSFRSRR
jgi:hypothetical protein